MWLDRLKTVAKIYLFVAGMQFACFIIEESLQVLMFSSWIIKKPPVETAQLIADVFSSVLVTGRAINNLVGWLVPPLYVAYAAYWWSAETWLATFCQAHHISPRVDAALVSVLAYLLVGLALLGIFLIFWPKRAKGGSAWLKP